MLARMERTRFERNKARAFGGGIFYVDYKNCSDFAGRGGAVDADGTDYLALIEDLVMINNTADADGGAFYYEASTDQHGGQLYTCSV